MSGFSVFFAFFAVIVDLFLNYCPQAALAIPSDALHAEVVNYRVPPKLLGLT